MGDARLCGFSRGQGRGMFQEVKSSGEFAA
jgi:hypothetical protein